MKRSEEFIESKIHNREVPFSFSNEGIPILESTDIPELLDEYLKRELIKYDQWLDKGVSKSINESMVNDYLKQIS